MKNIRKRLYGIVLALVFVLNMAGVGNLQEVRADSGDMAVHFLDVGQGLSILVQSGGQNLLYDGGDRNASSFVVSYLKQQKVSTIDYVIASHYDADHISGLIGCLNAFSVENVIGSDYVHDSALYGSFMDGAEAQGLSVQHPEVGEEFSFGTGRFTILSPSESSNDSNNNSVAIRLTNGENNFIFTGDAEHQSEADMIAEGLDLSCDVLSLGHHGSASSTSWAFLEQTLPEYAVISCGEGNQYGHPDRDTMDKLSDMEINVFRTDKQGTIVAVSDGFDIRWNMPPCNDYTPGDEEDMGTLAEEGGFQSQPQEESSANETAEQPQEEMVWLSATGSKYHSIPDCGNMNPDKARQISLSQAESQGFEPCKKCW